MSESASDRAQADALWRAMAERRSVRRFRAEAPSRALTEELVAAATLAPSASNKQPWRFYVVDQRARIEAMAQAVAQAVAQIRARLAPEFGDAFAAYGDYFTRFVGAPVVVVPVWRPLDVLSHMLNAPVPDAAVGAMEQRSGLISVALAMQNLMLYAHARGLASSCMSGPLLAEAALKAQLGIAESWHIAAIMPLGFADETPPAPGRKAAATVLRWVD